MVRFEILIPQRVLLQSFLLPRLDYLVLRLWTGTFAPEEQLMYGSAKDITERKLAEAESQRQSRRSQLSSEITLKIRQSLNIAKLH